MHGMTPIELAGDMLAIESLREEQECPVAGAVLRERIAAVATR